MERAVRRGGHPAADGEAYRLYESFGFRFSAPRSQGMLPRL